MRKFLPDLLIILLLLALPLIIFAPQTLGGQTMLPADNLYQWEPFATYREVKSAPEVPHNALLSDLVLENYVWKDFVRSSISGGEIPLWNPHLFAGVPFLAAGQHSALYPLSVIYYVLPLAAAYGWYTVVQLWLAGLFMLMFARGLGQGRTGATVAAVSWQLSGFFLARAVFPMIISAAAWLPLLLLMVEYVIRARPLFGRPATLPWAAGGAIGLGLVVYAGHVEITYYILLVMGFYAAARLLAGAWAARREAGTIGKLVRRGGWLLVMVIVGLALGAAQFLPLFEVASQNFREGSRTLEEITGWAYPKRRALAFLMPNFFGNPSHHAYWDVFSGQTVPATVNALGEPIDTIYWGIKNYVEGGAYLGILPMALAAFGLVAAFRRRRPDGATKSPPSREYRAAASATPVRTGETRPVPPYRAIFATLAVTALTFIFGLPTYAILYTLLPGFNQLHSPFRWVFPMTLCVAMLAGYGADALLQVRRTDDDRWARRFGWALLGAGGLTLGGLLLSRLLFAQIEPLVDRALRALALAETAFADASMFYSYQFGNALLLGLFLAAAGLVFLLSRRTLTLPGRLGGGPAWPWLAVAVIALDLALAIAGFYPAVDPALLDFTPPSLEWLQGRYAEEGPFRITTLNEPGVDTLHANIPWMYGLQDVRGYDSIIPKQYTDYMALISPQFQLDFNRVAPLTTAQPWALESPLLDLLNVRYVVTESTIDDPGWPLVYEDAAVRIYENTHVMPRAYTLPGTAQLYYTADDDFAELVQTVDPRTAVMVYVPVEPPDAPPGDRGFEPGQPAAQPITEYRNVQVTVEATVDEPSWLVLGDSIFTGWRAYVRPAGADEDFEREFPLHRVNGNFRGVRIDPAALAESYAEQVVGGEVTLSETWAVRFRYSPASFQVGAFLSFMAGVVIVFAAGVYLWRTFYGGEDEGEAGTMRRLGKNSIVPIVINLFNKGIDFALAFIVLRVLGPQDAGIYYYAIVVFGWFDILTNFGLNTFLTREVARDRSQAGRYLLNTSVLRLALSGLGVPLLVIFLLARQALASPPLDATAITALGLLYVGLLPTSLSTGMSALFYAFEKAEYPAAITTVGAISKAVLGLSVLVAGWGVIGLAGASIVTNLITLALMLYMARGLIWPEGFTRLRRNIPVVERPLLRHMVGESWPLMINHLLATIFFKIDVILMEPINGVTVVGWYSTAYKWLDALNVIPAFLSAALLPVMSRQAQEDTSALAASYRLSVKLLLMVALPLAVATTFIAYALIMLLGGPQYLPDGALALQLMIWSIPIGWVNSVTQYVLIALDQQRLLTRVFFIAVVFNIGANLVFLPIYSYPAAAVITILSEALLLAMFLRLLKRTLRVRLLEASLSEAEARGALPLWGMAWRPAAAALLMFGVMVLVWPLSGPLAVVTGVIVYLVSLVMLRPLDAHEQAQLAPLVPGRLRAGRMRAGSSVRPAS